MQMDRRDFLKLSGATLAGGAVLSQGTVVSAGEDDLGILYDASKCVGCRACQEACKQWNQLPAETTDVEGIYDSPQGLSADTWTLIELRKRADADWSFFNYQCMHCADAACVTVCPTGALFKDERGFTAYNRDKCIGCGYCTQFCPFGVPHLKVESLLTGKAKAAKCTFCQDRIWNGLGGPSCAERCPVGALVWGNRAELLATAKARVEYLHGEGMDTAQLYGETEAGGLHRLSILFGSPGEYGLSTRLAAPTVAGIWQNVVQILGAIAIAGSVLGAFAAFLVSRSNIQMEEVE
jgi:formate dehydrogenase iron-sulfur subunit